MKLRNVGMLSLIVMTQILLAPATGLAQNRVFTLTPVLKRGDARPDGGSFFDCPKCTGEIQGLRAFNSRGDLIISVNRGFEFEGAYLLSGGNTTLMFDALEVIPFMRLELREASIDNQGRIVLTAFGYINNDTGRYTLFRFTDGELIPIIADGDPAPNGDVISRSGILSLHANDNGDVVFDGATMNEQGVEGGEIFLYSDGVVSSVVTSGNPSPIGGVFSFVRLASRPQINSKGDILFFSSVIDSDQFLGSGLFLATSEGIKKIVISNDLLPTGLFAETPVGTLNDRGDVAFSSNTGNIFFESEGGIYLFADEQIQKVMRVGDQTPIGGKFAPFGKIKSYYPLPIINNSSAMVFKAAVKGGSSKSALFIASPKAIIKVVAEGDKLNGDKIASIGTFAFNDLGEVVFFAFDKNQQTMGVFKATPATPEINSIKLKRKRGRLELRVKGSDLITNDSVIEINGQPLEATRYPVKSRENGGTTALIISSDARLEELLQSGHPVQVTVFNPLTNRRSESKSFSR